MPSGATKNMKLKLTGKELRAIGFPEGPVISIAMKIMQKNFKHHSKEDALEILKPLLENPGSYADNEILGAIAEELIPEVVEVNEQEEMRQSPIHFDVFGAEHIEQGAMHQMYTA